MRLVWLLLLACTAANVRLVAAQRVAVEVLAAAEVWETDAGGGPATLTRTSRPRAP